MSEKSSDKGYQGEISQENIILYDWLSVTSKVDSPDSMIKLLGMSPLQFEEMRGFNGYKSRLYYDGISVHYDGNEEMGVNLEMSGQGCRVFETFGHGEWQALFDTFTSSSEDYNITRLDVAYDDHEGLLNIKKIADSTKKGTYISKAKSWAVEYSNKGTSVYIGSKKSEVLIRFYDKAAERGIPNKHWIRCELQMRRERAYNFIMLKRPLGEKFSGVLNNYVRYVKPTADDSNTARWKTEKWWLNFVKTAEKISIFTKKDIEYNLNRVEKYVFKQAGNSIDTFIRCVGEDYFFKKLKERGTKMKEHHLALIRQYEKETGETVGKEEYEEARVRAEYENITGDS